MPEFSINFGPLAADEPAFRNPGIIRALNLVPRSSSFGPMRALAAQSNNALTARALGGLSARSAAGNTYVYAGDAAKLYEMVGQTFTDESKGGGYSTAADDVWEFAVWAGSNKVIATNYTNPVQSIAVGGGGAGAFADMITSTNVPKAKHVGIVGNFVVLGFTNDVGDGEKSNRVWWSAIDDETDFDPSAATQCDYEDLSTGGQVQKIVGNADYGLIFQADMVRSMRYTGAGTIFSLQPLNFTPGTFVPNSVVSFENETFYIAEEGFMALRGLQVEHLGDRLVDRFFLSQFDPQNARLVSSAIDPANKLVAWAFPGADNTGLPNRILMCKYDDRPAKWAEAEIDTEVLLTSQTQGYTLDGLDAIGTNIDDAAVFDESFDSSKWQGGAFRFGAFDQTHTLSFFNGPTLSAVIDTGDILPVEGKSWRINGVRPLVDGGGACASVAPRKRLQDSISYGPPSEMNANGVCKLRSEGKYQRIRVSLSSSTSWSHIQGIAVDGTIRGAR